MNLLLYHNGALGDFITTLPLIASMRKLHGASVTLLGRLSTGELAREAGYVDSILDAGSNTLLYLFCERPDPPRLRRFFSPYSMIVLFAATRSPLVRHAHCFSSAEIKVQPPFPETVIHAIDYHLLLLDKKEKKSISRVPVIRLSGNFKDPQLEKKITAAAPCVAIHPGSGSRLKNWPFNRFLETADSVKKLNVRVVWITGPAEENLSFPPGDLSVASPSLTDLGRVLSFCSGFIGNDSGITHLAAASGCPVVVLFGPSNPVVWAPRGLQPVRVLYRAMECSPCHLQPDRPFSCTRKCLRGISVDDVVTALTESIKATACE